MSLLQEYVKKHGTDGLNKKYVDQALANGGGNGATAAGIYSPSLVDNNFITSFLSETRRYMQDAESDLGSVGYKNASSLYSSHFDRLNDLKKRRDAISMYLKGNKDKFDEEFYNTFTSDLDLYGSAFEEYQSAFKSTSDFYSQFDTEQDYNDYVAAEEDRKQKMSFDLSAGKKELDDLYAQRDEARQIQNRINGLEWQVNEGDGSEATQMALEKLRAQLKQYGDLDSTITQKEQYYNEAKRLQSGEKLKADAVNAADFEEFAKKGADIKNPTMAEAERGFQVFGWKPFAEQVGNEVTYSRENYDELFLAEMMGTDGMEGKSLYHYMTDEEVKIYNYYLAKEGKDKADEYLYSIEESLNARQGGVLADSAAGNLALQYLLGAAAGLDQFASGVKSIFSDEDYINTSAMQFASGMVREDLSETGPKVLGSSLGQVGYDLINTTANMAPSILASTIISTVATPVAGAAFGNAVGATIGSTAGKVVGAGLLGASAGGNAYAEKLNAGYSKDQAAAYGMMVAASEAGLEYLIGGISKMGGKLTGKSIEAIANNIDNAVGRVAAKWGMSMLAEGTEEYLQDVLNPWYENIVFNMNNDVTLLSEDALYSGLLGALSAGVLEGRSTISADRAMTRYGESLKKDGLSVERLKSLGQTFAADTVAYELAGKVDENTGAYTIARLFNEVNAQLSEQNKADIVKSLERKGYATEHAEIIANQLAAAVDGAEFGALQRYVLDHNEDIAKTFFDVIVNPNSTVNQRRVQSATSLFELAKEVDKARVQAKYAPTSPVMKSAEQYDADAKTAATNSSATLAPPERFRSSIEINFDEGIPASPEALARSIAESRRVSPVEQMAAGLAAAEKKAMGGLTVSESGKLEHKPTGKEIGKLTIVSDKDKKLKLKTESGEIVDAKDVNFRSKDEAMVYSAVLGMGVNPVVAQSIVDNFDGTDGMVYAADVKLAYQYGKMNFPKSLLEKLEIKPHQAEHAYKLGRSDAKVAKSKTGRSTQYKRGSLVYEYDVDESTLTPMQKVGIDGLKMLADLSSVRFHIFESTMTEDGYRFTKPDGTVTGANGWYLEGTNDIWVDINSGNFGQGLMMHTVAHEISHYIKEWSPAKWQAMADFLLEQYGEKGVPVHILLERQMQKVKRRNPSLKGNALMDAAYEELVSDAMSEMLVDGRVAEKMQALKKKDAALWEKIKDAIKDLLDRWGIIRKEYKGVTPEAAEAQFLHDMDEAFSKLQDMFAEAFADADANFSVAGLTVDNSINMESDVIDSANVGILGKPRSAKMQERTEYLDAPKQAFSVSTTNGKTDAKMVTADDIRKEGWFTGTDMSVKALRDARFKQNGFTKKQIDAMNGFIKDAADAMAKARLKYRFIGLDDIYNAQIVISPVNGSITISAMVKNGDYAVNFDFTKICKKRVALQQVIEELAMDKGRLNEDGTTTEVDLSSANIKRINDILASYGVETACLCCFVESKRYNMQSLYQEKVIDVWNRLVAEFDHNAPYFDGAETPVDISKVPDSEFDALLEQVEKWKKRKGPEGEVVEEKMRAFLENTPAARKKLRFSDLVTATGRTNLHKLYPQVESLVLQKLGTAAPKSVEAFTPYNGEIDLLEAKGGKDLVKYIASIAGVRSQSFSDFMIAHVFDVLQKTASLSARKLPAHTYTKEIARALLFGMTGEKHNMSVLHNIDPNVDSWQAGLSEDGQYLFSDYKAYRDGYSQFIQSIGWEDAVALQNTEGYSKDCGVIAVGFSYLHMKKIHADPDVRQVIGYHTSDMPVEVKPMTHLDKSTDYTPVQNTLNFGGFAVPQYDIPDGVPSYATPPQDVMVGRKGPKTKKSSVQFDIKERFAELSAGKTGAARTAAAKQTLRELLQLAEENGLVLKTTKAKAAHGDFNLYEDLEKTGDPYVTTDHYIEYCIENGWLPMFYEFALDQNYYKDNFDFNVFDRLSYNPETGLHEDTADRKAYAPQTAVHMLNEDGTLSFPEDFFEIVDKQMAGYDQYQQYVAQKMPDIMRDIRSIKDDSGKPMISKESTRDADGDYDYSDRDQEYNSKDTSVKILPATFTKFGLKPTDRVLDWGGGQYDIAKKAVEHGYPGIKFEVVDAFNRTETHNDRILAEYKADPATVLTINNVLNVIKETEIIEDVIRESKEYLAADGVCYIKIYEGNDVDGKTGNGKVTSSGWQNNQPAEWYRQFAEKYYQHVERVGDILIASDKPINRKSLPKVDKDVAGAMRGKVKEIAKSEASMRESLYSDRDTDSVSNRDILANAFMDVAQKDVERSKIAEYQQEIKALDEDERKLRDIRAQLHDLSFSAGPRDNAKIRELREKATKLANRIGSQDKQLLRLEASKPLMAVLEREKKLAYSRASQKWEDRIETARTGRSKTEMRHKIKKIVGELNNLLLHGTKDKHIMIGLQKATAEALSAINMDTVAAEKRLAKIQAKIDKATDPAEKARLQQSYARVEAMGDNMATRLTALKNAYEEIKDSSDPLVANAYQPEIEERIKNLRKMVGDTPLRNMSMEQLEFTYDTYKMVLTTIRNANKAFKNERGESIAVLGNRAMEEIGRVGGKKDLVASAMRGPLGFAWSGMKPTYAFKAIGSDTLSELFSQVRAGEDVWATDVNEAKEFYSQKTKQYHYDSWDLEKEYTFTSKSGKEFKLTLEQIMSLYAYSKRKQADAHLEKGGFVFDSSIEVVKRSKLGIPVKYRVNTAHAHALSRDTLMEICKTLTDEQVKFVDEMQDYLSTVMGEKGNEVSLKMYGVKLFKEKFYFPLKSAKQFMYEQYEVAGDRKIKNSGFSKDTTPHASNPVILNNFTDVWATHVNDMAMYHAFVLPMEDFERVFNYKTPTSDTMPTESVKGYLQDAYGVHPEQYIKQLMTDLNGGARIDPTAGIINKGIAMFKKSAVFASLSVVIQQPSAIARAMAYIDAKYFVGKPGLKDWDEVKKYAPVAIIKEMGYFDTNMGKSTVEFIKAKEYTGVKSKMKALVTDRQYRDEILSKAPSVADELAWCQIWNAVKKEIAETKKLQGEELLQAAGKRFTEVIVNTQVYDSVLTRSGMMRSKDTGMKMATSFMAEPTTSLNMIADALIHGKRGNKSYARKAIGAVAASMILNSILVSFVYAGRDDDEDKTYIEKYAGSLTSELIDSFNPLTLIPFVKDIVSIAQGYDVERSDMAVITDLFNAWKKLSSDNLSVYRKVEGFGGAIASIFGLPLKNIMRDVRGIYNTVKSAVAGPDTTGRGVLDAAKESLPKWMGGGERSNADQLYAAMLSGDTGHVERLKARFKDDRAFTYAVRDGLVNNDKRITAAAEARAAGNQTEYMRLAREIVNEGHFSQDDVVRAVNYVLNSLTKKESEPAEATKPDTFKIDEYLSEALSGDQAEAELVKREIIAGHVADGKTEDEALKSFNDSFKNTAVKGAFTDGDITMDVAISMLQQYGGVESADAYADVQYWQFKKEHPDIYVVDSWFDSYYEYASDAGIGIDVYMQYRNDVKNITGENKKERRMDAINALPLSPAQKDALYFDEGWVASKLHEAPWR